MTDKLSHEMEAKKNSVSTMGATHEKQIEAINIDNIFIPEYQPQADSKEAKRRPWESRPETSVKTTLRSPDVGTMSYQA